MLGVMAIKKISTEAKRSNFLKLINESDRGAVSVVCEMFNKRLAAILVLATCANLIKKKKIPKDFGYRIQDAFSFKLITAEQHKALKAIQDLRNDVNHSDLDFSLADKGVVGHLKALEKYARMIDTERLMDFEDILQEVDADTNMPRFQFLVTSFQVYNELQNKIYELADNL